MKTKSMLYLGLGAAALFLLTKKGGMLNGLGCDACVGMGAASSKFRRINPAYLKWDRDHPHQGSRNPYPLYLSGMGDQDFSVDLPADIDVGVPAGQWSYYGSPYYPPQNWPPQQGIPTTSFGNPYQQYFYQASNPPSAFDYVPPGATQTATGFRG